MKSLREFGIIELIEKLNSLDSPQLYLKEILTLCESENMAIRLSALNVLKKMDDSESEAALFRYFLENHESKFYVVTEAIIERKCCLEEICRIIVDTEYPVKLRKTGVYILLRIYTESNDQSIYQSILNTLSYVKQTFQKEILGWIDNFGMIEFSELLSSKLGVQIMPSKALKPFSVDPNLKKRLERKTQHLVTTLTAFDMELAGRMSFFITNQDIAGMIEEISDRLNVEKNSKIVAILIRLLGYTGESGIIPVIIPFLECEDSRVRADSVETLVNTRNESVIKLIMPLIDDEDNRVKANVASGLWSFGGLRAISILKEMLDKTDSLMRQSAVYALGEIRSIQVLDILKEILYNDPVFDVKQHAILALEKILDPQVVPILAGFIIDESIMMANLKVEAVVILSRIGNEDAIEFLEELIEYKSLSLQIREEANFQLKMMQKEGRT
ncbi:HEAT repeat domain-containing protein [bacterium]|nr:HEAT repeat domain-containing protein [bacterium]